MKNTHRVFEKESDGQSYFFRNNNDDIDDDDVDEPTGIQYQENGLSIVPDDYKRFRINIDFTINETAYTRQLLLNFHDTATMGFDYGLELSRSDSYSSDAYFNIENKEYSGQAFPFEVTLVIPLTIDIEQQQPLRFRIFDIQNFEDSQGIYIHDNNNDSYTNLRNLDYELNIAPGTYTNRFEIVFTTESTLGIDEFDVTSLTIRQDNGNHQISVQNTNGLNIKSLEVFNVAGNRLLKADYNTIENQYDLSTKQLSDGVYVVNVLMHTNSKTKSQKIIVKN